jgi:hypothetical protein
MNRPVERRGNTWFSGLPLCEVDRFIGGRTVTLRWLTEDRHTFHEVERLIREAVRTIISDENPSTRWLMSSSIGSGLTAICCFGLLAYALSLFR